MQPHHRLHLAWTSGCEMAPGKSMCCPWLERGREWAGLGRPGTPGAGGVVVEARVLTLRCRICHRGSLRPGSIAQYAAIAHTLTGLPRGFQPATSVAGPLG